MNYNSITDTSIVKGTIGAACLSLLLSLAAFAQEEATAEAVSPLIEFSSIQKSDGTITLTASVKAKIKGSLTKLAEMPLSFLSVTDSAETTLGQTMTSGNGTGSVNFASDKAAADREGKLHFKVMVAGNPQVEAGEEVLEIKKAKLTLEPFIEDSVTNVRLKLSDLSTGTAAPLPETGLNLYVKRTFSNLKVGEGTTDENGEAVVEVPVKLPGDAKGNLHLIARLDENETYGTVEASVSQAWGVPVSDEVKELPRALWSTHPPIWMLITFSVLMTAVWGHYIVIIFELFRLRNEHA